MLWSCPRHIYFFLSYKKSLLSKCSQLSVWFQLDEVSSRRQSFHVIKSVTLLKRTQQIIWRLFESFLIILHFFQKTIFFKAQILASE